MNIKNLKKITKNIFIKHGLNNKHAETSSNYIIKAELVGAPSHGLARLKMYCNRIKKNLINSNPKIKIKNISQSISHVDADNAIGFVAADAGIKTAISNAKMAYALFVEKFGSSEFNQMSKNGAKPQRPLWASTSTKNPNFSEASLASMICISRTV